MSIKEFLISCFAVAGVFVLLGVVASALPVGYVEPTRDQKISAGQKSSAKYVVANKPKPDNGLGLSEAGVNMVAHTNDCDKLQHMFNQVYSGHGFVTNKSDALNYIDRKMTRIGCYG